MCPPVAGIALDVSDVEVIFHLMSIKEGSGLPNNVISDTNPCLYPPANLPSDMWYLIALQEKQATEYGIWKAKEGTCKLFCDSVLSGWKNTLQFYEGPHERKTDWLMDEFWITRKGHGETGRKGEANALCRIFLGGVQDTGHGNFSSTETHSSSTRLAPPQDRDVIAFSNSSERKTEVEQSVETGRLAMVRTNLKHRPPGIGDLAGGNYLELLDLETPLSPSSISDNSSRGSMSSGECFDSLDLLRDLEAENTDLVQNDERCKLNVSATNRPDELFMLPLSPGRYVRIEESEPAVEEICRKQQLTPTGSNNLDNIVLPHSVKNQGADNRVEGPSSSYQDKGAPSSSRAASASKQRKADKGRLKNIKRNCFCFVPF